MPSKWAKKEWQKEQEANLQYVAFTRAKLELYFVTSDFLRDCAPGIEGSATAATPARPATPAAVETRQPGEVRVGDKVEVVKGKKVPLGTKGVVVKCFGEPWFGIVIKCDGGGTQNSYAKNVRVL